MSLSAKLRRAPLRLVTGAFILNSGVSKLSADTETANAVHGMATGTYPFLDKVEPRVFVKGLAAGEIAVGGALLLPVVSPLVAGAALAGFSGALLNMYWRTPGMHEEGDPRPTQQGIAMAKDSWMFGIGTGLVVDSLLDPVHTKKTAIAAGAEARKSSRSRRAQRKQLRRAAGKARGTAEEIGGKARGTAEEVGGKARGAAEEVGGKARGAAEEVGGKASRTAHDVSGRARSVAHEASGKARAAAHEAGGIARSAAHEAGGVARSAALEAGGIARTAAQEAGGIARTAAHEAAERAKNIAPSS